MKTKSNKETNITIRISLKDKKLLEKCARLNHLTLSAYITLTCLKQAELDLIRNDVLHLNNEQMDFIIRMINNPSKPNEELKRLFKTK